jgi:hypothetical protein
VKAAGAMLLIAAWRRCSKAKNGEEERRSRVAAHRLIIAFILVYFRLSYILYQS